MKTFSQLRIERMSPAQMKKLGIEDPLSGKGYPYQDEETMTPAQKKKREDRNSKIPYEKR